MSLAWRLGFFGEWTGLPGVAAASRALRRRGARHLADAPPGGEAPVAEVDGPRPLGPTPWVWRGGAASWPALQRWTPRALADRFGGDDVLVGHATELVSERRRERLADFIAAAMRGEARYLRFWPVLDRHPEVADELRMDDLRRLGGVGRPWHNPLAELYIGGAGTGTGLHHVVVSNLFVQLYGEKDWVLHPPDATPCLDPAPDRASYWTSARDPERPEGGYRAAPRLTTRLRAGDILWVPPWWWHAVRNPSLSIGLSYWWAGARAALREPFPTGLAAFGRPGLIDVLLGQKATADAAAEVVSAGPRAR